MLTTSARVVGVDGCKAGWIAAVLYASRGTVSYEVHQTLEALLRQHKDASAAAVDMPIGLEPNRECDRRARKFIGPRRSSVFPTPAREILGIGSHAEASDQSRRLFGKGLSKQSFAIFPKLAEVDCLVHPELQERVIEVHPEVSFRSAAGDPLTHSKKKKPGLDERRAILERALPGIEIPNRSVLEDVGLDDVLDALIAAWSAQRFAEGKAERLPSDPKLDGNGLRMAIYY